MKFAHLALIFVALAITAIGQDMPKPELRLVGVSDQVNNGHAVRLFEIEIVNRAEISDEFFVAAPALPPCGTNANSSRTWINLYNEDHDRVRLI